MNTNISPVSDDIYNLRVSVSDRQISVSWSCDISGTTFRVEVYSNVLGQWFPKGGDFSSTKSRSFSVDSYTTYEGRIVSNHGSETYFYFTTSDTPVDPRPDYWYWSSIVEKGSPFNVTADNWNSLLNYINDLREYKGMSRVDFSNFKGADNTARPGKPLYAYMYNNIKYTFREEWGTRSDVSVGDSITAEHLLWLQDVLNAVS